jgi:hypothetical protein
MKLIKNFFEKRKLKKLTEKNLEESRKAEMTKKRLATISTAETKMLSASCPFQKGNCIKACAHFQEGKLTTETNIFDAGVYSFEVAELPKCKLWK